MSIVASLLPLRDQSVCTMNMALLLQHNVMVYFAAIYLCVSDFFFMYPLHQHLPSNFRSPKLRIYLLKIYKLAPFHITDLVHETLSVNCNVTPQMKDDGTKWGKCL